MPHCEVRVAHPAPNCLELRVSRIFLHTSTNVQNAFREDAHVARNDVTGGPRNLIILPLARRWDKTGTLLPGPVHCGTLPVQCTGMIWGHPGAFCFLPNKKIRLQKKVRSLKIFFEFPKLTHFGTRPFVIAVQCYPY